QFIPTAPWEAPSLPACPLFPSQNDYLGWINRAKRPETKEKRLAQMLYELERGELYMNMEWGKR
ncbi:MAG TPA: YdeI/OmpD-associated family protein, partial [Candidatus Deferrimicrobium sp.]|nr:YdeI/OmpD-associated family protein [Candidatus Deferrimicrobium sp.]